MKTILLMSGGIDSFVGKAFLNPNKSIYFDLKTKYSEAEKKNLIKNHKDVIIDDTLSFLGRFEREDAYLPFRNLWLILGAVLIYDADIIYLCGVKEDKMKDNKQKNILKISELMTNLTGKKIEILSPFWDKTKPEICKKYASEFSKKDLIEKTYSCYVGNDIECEQCLACLRKRIAIYVGTDIFLPFKNMKLVDKCLKELHTYDEDIQQSMKKYFNRLEDLS